MVRKNQSKAETGPNFSIYRKEVTVTPALEPEEIIELREATAKGSSGLTAIIGLSEGVGEKTKRSTLLRFENEDATAGAESLVEGVIGRGNPS